MSGFDILLDVLSRLLRQHMMRTGTKSKRESPDGRLTLEEILGFFSKKAVVNLALNGSNSGIGSCFST